MKSKKDLSVNFLGVKFKNPFCLSSSPVGNCYEMCAKAFELGWGGIVYKTLFKTPSYECSPRYDILTKEDLPWVGFKNMEQLTEHNLEDDLRDIARLKKEYPDGVIIASIMAKTEEDWTEMARLVEQAGADMIELNFSCPQMTDSDLGSAIGQKPEVCKRFCQAVKRGTKLPVIAKMTPNITDMCEPAIASIEGGADAISAINTIKSICNVDLDKKVGLPIVNGKSSISGYSGKAVKPIALRFTPPGWINWSLIAVAFILGLLTDQFASESSRINLLSLPFFGVLLWNIVVYLMLLISGLRHKTSRDFLGLRAALGIIEKTATLHNTRLTKSLTSVLQPFVASMNNCWTPVENMGKAIRNGTVTKENAAEQTKAMNDAMNSDGI